MYYPKLREIAKNPRQILMLSQLVMGRVIEEWAISDRRQRQLFSLFRKKKIIDKYNRLICKLPVNYTRPFIYINKTMVEKCGLIVALVLSFCRGKPDKLIENGAIELLSISRASFFRYKKVAESIDRKFIENIFKKESSMIDVEASKQKAIEKQLAKLKKKALNKNDIGNLFMALCITYNYHYVPYPSRATLSKAINAMKNVSDISIAEVLERMISNWSILVTIKRKPTLPDLRLLPICLTEVCGMKIAPVKIKKLKEPEQPEQIDEYIEGSYF